MNSEMPPKCHAGSVRLRLLQLSRISNAYWIAKAGVIPDLLAPFSASPVDTFKVGMPLFTSDRSFVKSACDDAAVYFDPLGLKMTAKQISDGVRDSEGNRHRPEEHGKEVCKPLPTIGSRASTYLKIRKNSNSTCER